MLKLTRFERATFRSAIWCSIQLSYNFIFGILIPFGAGGIRTPGTLSGHNSLAGSPIRPLSHRSKENKFHRAGRLTFQIVSMLKSRSRGDSSSSRKHPVYSLQTASVLPAHPCAVLFFQGLRLSIFTGVLRFESPIIMLLKLSFPIKRIFRYFNTVRSRGDSNPRNLSAQRFSRPPPSTARTPLQYQLN